VRHKPKTPAGDRGYCLLRAGDRNRTGVASLEDWGSAIELHPRGAARLRPGSNRRPSARQADALPLSYEAKNVVRALGRSRTCTLRRRKPSPSPLGHEGRSCEGECDRRESNPRGPNGPTRVTAWRDEADSRLDHRALGGSRTPNTPGLSRCPLPVGIRGQAMRCPPGRVGVGSVWRGA